MIQEQWDSLPELLTPWSARRLLGVSRETLRVLEQNTPELAVVLPGMKQRRYRKSVLARLVGAEYGNGQIG